MSARSGSRIKAAECLPRARFTLFNTLPPSHSAVEESNVLNVRTITSDEALGGLESCSQILHSSKSNRTYRLRVLAVNLHPQPILQEKIMAAKVSYIPKDYNSVTPYLIVKERPKPSTTTRKCSVPLKQYA